MKKQYICKWCDTPFECEVNYTGRVISTATGQTQAETGKAYQSSTIVRCPKCNNCIPTWKKELTGSLTGRKHVHRR